jgi:hypothetical protein
MSIVETAAPAVHGRHALRCSLPWRDVVRWALALWLVTRALDIALTIVFTTGSAAQRLDH